MQAATSNTSSTCPPSRHPAAAYGCTDLICLDQTLSSSDQLGYLDLLPKKSKHEPMLSAVAEHQGVALLYLVDKSGDTEIDVSALTRTRRLLANRSDPAWLGVLRPGSLDIYPIGFHVTDNNTPVKTVNANDPAAPLFFQRLAHGTFDEVCRPKGTDYVYQEIFRLLTQTMDEFVPVNGNGRLDALDVLSMAGRALFFRFLIDRDIVRPCECSEICGAVSDLRDAFSTIEAAAQTSAWLDKTYNGDFLPLINESIPADDHVGRKNAYSRFYEGIAGKADGIFDHLQAILRGWRNIGGKFQPELELDWADLNFKHIPVGVLSQVYESFSHRVDSRTARETSVHYTPRTVASLMVDQAFAAVKDKAAARVLDPSCGAGIFLVLAFRRLVCEAWVKDGKRPDTKKIQDILYKQVYGFDISEPALRLAALSLYVTAIELNASPRPPHALKFPLNLRDEVLHRFGEDNSQNAKNTVFPLGSLGSQVPSKFNGMFDIVIGNPPWTPLSGNDAASINKHFTAIGRRVFQARGLDELVKSYENPDNDPDLPFLWRATEWVVDDGVIALAMHARLFGRTGGNGFKAWKAVLRSVKVTGLINGADLRTTAVWENISVPFCVLFARNGKPDADHKFYYAAPKYEKELNSDGRFRIDYEAAQPVSAARVEKQPWLLKTLQFGTWLDVEIIEDLLDAKRQTLINFWRKWDVKKKQTGRGVDRSASNPSKNIKGSPQKFVRFLTDLPYLASSQYDFEIAYENLQTYGEIYGINKDGEVSAHRPRQKELFQSPLVIIPEKSGDSRKSPKAFVSNRSIAFSKSYYGYSCAGHPEADTLAALIYLLPHTMTFAYFRLMTSRREGFDRQTFNKEEFDALPFPDLKTLSETQKSTIRDLAQRLRHDAVKPWNEINEFISGLYGLDADAVQVMEDTLFSAASYRKAGREAFDRTIEKTRAGFVTTLQKELEPYFDVCGEHVTVREGYLQIGMDTWREPWFFLTVSQSSNTINVNSSLMRKAMEIANQKGCSRIIVRVPGKRGLLIGLLNQRRWWTITRARLCAQHIIRNHLGAFGLPD